MSKFSINLDAQVIELDGSTAEGDKGHLGRIISGRIGMFPADGAKNQNVGVTKLYGWSRTLYSKKPLELDREDLNKFEEVVQVLNLPVVIVGQVLEIIQQAKDAAKKEL